MKAAKLFSIGDFRCIETEIPEIRGEEILLRVHGCGICGSDIPRIYQHGTSNGKYPLTIGHEFSGEVAAVGDKADPDLIGKRGAVFPIIPCRKCVSCESGNYAMCSDYDYLGSRRDGGFAEYCVLPSAWHLVQSSSDTASYASLAMTEPATVAQHAVRKAGILPGQSIIIFGAGPIGIMAARWAKIFGASKVFLVARSEAKVRFAEQHGCRMIDSSKEDITETLKNELGGKLCDVAIEGTGSAQTFNQCIENVKAGGTVVLMGNPSGDTTITRVNHSSILRKELVIQGIWNSCYSSTPINEWQYTVSMMDSGMFVSEDLVTHRVGLEELPNLCEAIHNREVSICKAICEM